MAALSKIRLQLKSNEWLVMVVKALEYYRDSLNYNVIPYQDNYVNEFKATSSMVAHMINKYQLRMAGLYTTSKPRLQEYYHDALLLREALQYYQAQTTNILHNVRCGSLYEELDLQIVDMENRIIKNRLIQNQ